MPNLKDIKTRIGSVKKTRQITSAMKLVAAARLRSATERALAAKPYQAKLTGVLARVSQSAGGDVEDPLLAARPEVRKVLAIVLTSDRGLCGGFNNNLMRRFQTWQAELTGQGVEVDFRIFGRKGSDFSRAKKLTFRDSVVDYTKGDRMEYVRDVTSGMVAGFKDGEYDEVYVVFNTFVNAITQDPTFRKVLPLKVEGSADESSGGVDYLYEPSAKELISTLLPLYLQTLVLQAFLDTEAGELAARMTAMDSATNNASDLIDRLTLEYNRARQAAITTEITEIVSGAEAL
jgi:F-type H+-transporting ATPase subunit gamma